METLITRVAVSLPAPKPERVRSSLVRFSFLGITYTRVNRLWVLSIFGRPIARGV